MFRHALCNFFLVIIMIILLTLSIPTQYELECTFHTQYRTHINFSKSIPPRVFNSVAWPPINKQNQPKLSSQAFYTSSFCKNWSSRPGNEATNTAGGRT